MTAASVGIGVAGAGYWGKNLVRAFAATPGARLVAVADADPKTRERMALAHPGARVVAELGDLLNEAAVDAVVLATPAALHAEHALACLSAGKHVLIEKPMALSVADGQRVAAAAETSGRVVAVGHLMAYHPGFRELQRRVRAGDLGELYYLYALRVNLGKVRTDENALWSLAPHDLTMIFMLIDEDPVSISARGSAYLRKGTEDVVFVNLAFGERGQAAPMANIHLSWLDPHKERRLTVVGSRAMAVFDDVHATEKLRIYDKGFDRPPEYASWGDFLQLRDGDIRIPRVSLEEPLAIECREFVAAVRGEGPVATGVAEGLRVVRVLAATAESLRQDGAPVRL